MEDLKTKYDRLGADRIMKYRYGSMCRWLLIVAVIFLGIALLSMYSTKLAMAGAMKNTITKNIMMQDLYAK